MKRIQSLGLARLAREALPGGIAGASLKLAEGPLLGQDLPGALPGGIAGASLKHRDLAAPPHARGPGLSPAESPGPH